MYRINKQLLPLLLILSLLFSNIRQGFCQTKKDTDSVLSVLATMPPEQLEAMLRMAINAMPPEKKGEIEESLNAMKSKTPEVKTVNFKDRTVSFVPLAHVSTPEFYQGVKRIVQEYKAQGYTVYYEQVRKDTTKKVNSPVDTSRLKLRKMMGVDPTRQTYVIMKKFFPDVVTQPEYKDLGITGTDINADVTIDQLIDSYETKYGKIALTTCDFNTDFETVLYPCDKLNNDINPIILDERNLYVVNLIKSSSDKKVLVLYGARHIKGMMELIGQ
ncbi:hypothetical protein D3C72_804040 [compost metagenome]